MKMKKLILLFSIVLLTVTFTSCLEAGSRSYTESAYVYIAMDDSGLIYGRTSTGRYITSNEMKSMMPGSFKFLAYNYDEVNGVETIGNYTADKVTIVPNATLDIPIQQVINVSAPEKTASFVAMSNPFYFNDPISFADHWIFEYAYKHSDGDKPVINFYKRDSQPNSNEVVFDVRITGVSSTGTTTKANAVALNMASIRKMYEGTSTTSTKDIHVKFFYYEEGKTEPTESPVYILRVKGN